MMSEELHWYWGNGSQPERYNLANSRDDAIEQATEYATDNGYEKMTVCEGKPWPLHDDFFDADCVLEQWHDRNEEAMDEDGELAMNPTREQKAELVSMLNAAFAAWRGSHNLGRAWCLDTRNEEIIEFPAQSAEEYPDNGPTDPAETSGPGRGF
jgi:hypothetical protein